jgi:hypothetical protein
MTTILTIFRKDIRHLWPHALAVSILMAISAILDPTYSNRGPSLSFSLLAGFALPLACWNFIIAAIHEEKLTGDRQYWLTRPYSWKDLLTAKVLLVAVFVNLPLFIWHATAYVAVGVPVWEHLPALLWRQFFFTALYVLPVAMLAAITRSIGQVILTALLGLIPIAFSEFFLLSRLRINWFGMEGILTATIAAIVIAGVAFILVLQYSQRSTQLSRVLAGALAVTILAVALAGGKLSGSAAPARENSEIRFSLDRREGRFSNVIPSGARNVVTLDIPVRVEGVPEGVDLVQNQISISLEGGTNRAWRSHGIAEGGFHDITAGTAWLTVFVARSAVEWGRSPTNVHGSSSFLAFGHQQILPLPKGHSVVVPRVGVCSDTHDSKGMISLFCYTPDPRASVTIGTIRTRLNWIIPQGLVDTSIPTSIDLQPLMKFSSLLSYKSWEEIGTTQLMTAEPLPPVHASFEITDVDLSQYVVKPVTEH